MEDFIDLLQNNDEVIFIHGARGGKSVLDYLEYSENLHRICCIATPVTEYSPLEKDNVFEKTLPVLPLYYLPHFRETGIFVVAVNPCLQVEIYRTLKQFGCKNIFFLSADAYNQIAEELKKFMTPEQIMQRFMDEVRKKLDDLEDRIEEREEVIRTNTAAFAEYKGAFRGKKVVLFGGGPTAKFYKPVPDAVHIGVNFAWKKEEIEFDFLFTGDKFVNIRTGLKIQDGFEKIHDKIFIYRAQRYSEWRFLDLGEDFSEMEKIRRFYYGTNSCRRPAFSDISINPLFCFANIMSAAIDFAIFTHPKKIYLVGCDTTRGGHFFKAPDSRYDDPENFSPTTLAKVGYARVKMFARQYYPDTEIISMKPCQGIF